MFSPIQYVRETVSEIRKVSWPTQQQTIEMTVLVLAVSVIVGTYIGVLDYVFQSLLSFII
ncbi:preprotein translocase subunit SecE [Candidatus Woesebacteria bacterium]|nr:preprotein translocase subunit SecE [Candidatus Woesebacteria bacterium]